MTQRVRKKNLFFLYLALFKIIIKTIISKIVGVRVIHKYHVCQPSYV